MPPTSVNSSGHQLTLPDADVTRDTITAAYLQFMFYCNPALPADCDTVSLEEAFCNPPRSGGKLFETFTIYNLVCKFYNKDIKTWSELITLLGVDPPDMAKDESAQKIAQYGVRLKKWMHSMHVKAFFEYLMGIPNEYWTDLPHGADPTAIQVRDGVALEDDMALRALLPHMRPKRGRKRPDAEDVNSPLRKKLAASSSAGDLSRDDTDVTSFDHIQTPATAWPANDVPQMHLSRWPQSTITPNMREATWEASAEPRSAHPSSKGHRRGTKNVSSAWRLGGLDTGAKPRGRPPVNRTPIEPTSAIDWTSAQQHLDASRDFNAPYSNGASNGASSSASPQIKPPTAQASPEGSRPARPSISLQVPKRQGGAVRLATPPPPPPPPPMSAQSFQEQLMSATNHQPPLHRRATMPTVPYGNESTTWQGISGAVPVIPGSAAPSNEFNPPRDAIPDYYFAESENRFNIDALVAFFVRLTIESEWTDQDGNIMERASVEEANAIIHSTLQNMYRTSGTIKEFLINLAALAGARMLMTGLSRCQRLGESNGYTQYTCEWEYRFGDLAGYFNMTAHVPFSMYRRPEPTQDDDANGDEDMEGSLGAAHWQEKYRSLLREVERKDMELFRLKNSLITSMKAEARDT